MSHCFRVFFALFALWLCLAAPISTTAHQVPSDGVSPRPIHHFEIFFGYEIPEDAFPLSIVFVGEPIDGLTNAQITAAIDEAANAWNQVPCSFAQFQWAGFRNSLDDVADDELPIYFGDMPDELSDVLAWTQLPTTAPPEGLSTRLNASDYRWSIDPHPFQHIDEPQRPIISLPAVLSHEFGHMLGLAHTEAHNAATMAANYLADGSQATLSADDKLGACHLYPRAESECVDDSDCPLSAPCIDGEYGDVCDIHLGDIGEYCAYDLLHCPGFCQIENEQTGTGYCSKSCDHDEQCTDHYSCLSRHGSTGSRCTFSPDADATGNSCSSTEQAPFLPAILAAMAMGWISRRPVVCLP